jgi:uncharacterized protein (TIRG00374 family)
LKRRLLIGILVSVFFLWLAFRKVDYQELAQALKSANYLWVFPNMALMVFSMWLRAYRWKFMVNPIKKVGLQRLFSSTMIGFMANNILPVRLGEIVRAYSLGSKAGISRTASFATIVLERVFDGFSLLMLLWITLLISPFPDWVKRAGNLTLALNVILLVVLIFLEVKTEPTLKFLNRLLRFLPRKISNQLTELLFKFTTGLKVFRDLPSMIWILIFSMFIWGVVGISNYFIFLAFDLYPPIQASFILLVMVSLAVMIPASPGYVGTFHFFCIAALGLFGYGKNLALPFSVVLHAAQYIPITLIGLIYLKTEHLTLKVLEKEQ